MLFSGTSNTQHLVGSLLTARYFATVDDVLIESLSPLIAFVARRGAAVQIEAFVYMRGECIRMT